MKLHLSLKLRAALLACYSIAAPVALSLATANTVSYADDLTDASALTDLVTASYDEDYAAVATVSYDEDYTDVASASYDEDYTAVATASYDDTSAAATVTYDTDTTAPATLDGGWVYVWGDEFNGDTLDETKWDYELGVVRNAGTQQAYTEDAVTVSNGNLTITSTYVGEGSDGVYNVNYVSDDESWFVYNTEYMPYSSGSVTTQNTYSFLYGRLEVSVKLPDATGAWPAIWMLGTSLYDTGADKDAWPLCGEIDILEHISQHDGLVYTTLHYTNSGLSYENLGYSYQFDASTWYDEFHVFAMEWDESQIKILVDDFCIAIFDLDAISFANGENPFEDPQFLILNTAIGGTWCELADDPSEYPVEYLIDYVRYYQFNATEADRGNGSIVWAATTDDTVTLTANTGNLRDSAGITSGDADIIVIDAGDSDTNLVYANWGDYTGNIRVDFQESYIAVGGWYAGHESGTLTGDLTMRFSGDSLGGVQSTAGQGVSVFGVKDGDIDGNVYIEFSNTGLSLGSMTSGEYSVASALRGSISGDATLVFNGGSYQYRVLGGIAVNASGVTNTIGGDVSVYVNGGVFYDAIIGGGIAGIVKGDSSIEITAGTFKDNITAGAAGTALVEGETSIRIYGSTGTFKDGITINASTDLSTQTSAATMSIVGEDASYTHSLNYFAGTLTGGNTTGTRTLAFDAANLDLSYATVTNFDAIALSNSSTVTFAASTDLSASTLSVNSSSLSFAAADSATEVAISNLTITSGSVTVGDHVSVVDGAGATNTAVDNLTMGVFTSTTTINLGTDASLSLADKINLYGGNDLTVTGDGTFSVVALQLGTANGDTSTVTIGEGATMHITGTDADNAGSANTTGYALNLGQFAGSNAINVAGTLILDAAMGANAGSSTITVTGTLQLNSGLDFNPTDSSSPASTINIESDGILALSGGSAENSTQLSVNLKDGAMIKSLTDTTVAQTINYTAGGTVTFVGENSTLTMASAISGISANIEGSVAVTAGATFTSLSVASDANLSISSAVAASTLSNAGAISLASGGSLSMGAQSGEGLISLDGGSLTLTADTLSAGIIVNSAAASIAVDNGSSTLTLDGTITYADWSSYQLSVTDGIALVLGENFALDFTQGLETGEYTLFSNSVTADDLSNVQISASNQYEYTYGLSITEEGLLKLTVSGLENLSIDADYAVTGAEEYDSIVVTTDSAISLTGEGSLEASDFVKNGSGSIALESAVLADTIVVNAGSITLQNGGALTGDTLSSDSTAAAITVASGSSLTVGDASDYVGKLVLSGGSVEIGNATESTSNVNLSGLSIGEGSTLTLADYVQVTVGSGADNDQGTWTDTKSFTLNLGTDALLSMDAQLCFYNNQTVNITGAGEFEVTGLRFSTYGTGVDSTEGGSTLNIGDGATMTVTGISTTDFGTSSVNLGGWNRGANTINVDGVLNINAALTQNAGSTNINVSSTGTLQLNEGLTFYNGTSTTKSTITLEDGATLILGNETESAKNGLTVTVGSSTIEAYGDATVYSTLSYTEGSAVTFKAGDDETLTMASAISGTNISANISGDVAFTAGATLKSLTLAANSSLTTSSLASVDSTSSTSIASGATLTVGDASAYEGSVTVSGGALVFDDAATANAVNLSNINLASGSVTIGDNVTVTEGAGALTTAPGTGVWTETLAVNLGDHASLSSADKLNIVRGNSVTVSGTGTYSVSGVQLGTGSVTGSSSLIIEDGATMNITGSDVAGSTTAIEYAFMLGNFDCDSTITVNGTLNVNAAMSAMSGGAAIGVSGTLQLNKGLDFLAVNNNYGGANVSSITVKDGGTLKLGTGTAASDSAFLTVSMESGSTIESVATTTVNENISYAGTTNFAGTTGTLTIATDISNSEGTANISGNVVFAGATTLATLDVAQDASLTLSNATNTIGNTSVSGALEIASTGSLDGDITLAGGSLTVDGALNNDLSVTAASSLASSTDAIVLNSTIRYESAWTASDSYTLDFGGDTVTLDEGFGMEFVGSMGEGEYTIFTNSNNAALADTIIHDEDIAGLDSKDYDYLWSSTASSLSLTISAASENLDIDSGTTEEGEDKTFDATTDKEVGSVTVNGDNNTTLTGEGSITSDSLDKSGSGDLVVGTTVESEKVTVTEGTVKVDEGGSLVSGNITVAAATDSTATLEQAVAGTDATVTDNSLTNAAVANAVVTVSGDASMTDSSIAADSTVNVASGATFTVTGDTASLEADTTLAENASVAAGIITVTGTAAESENTSSLSFSEGGALTAEKLASAVVSGATVVVGKVDAGTYELQTAPVVSGSSSLLASRSGDPVVYDNITEIHDTVFNDSAVSVIGSTELTMENIVLGVDSTLVVDSGASLILQNSTINADSTNLTIAETGSTDLTQAVATYTINTVGSLTSGGDVTIDGTLTINMTLSSDEMVDLANYWSNAYLLEILVDFGDASLTSTTTADNVVVQIFAEGSSYASYTVLGSVAGAGLGDADGTLTVTIPEPSTATLSLLALAGLLARRRRKQA